ncbi:hypothetical protein D3C75_1355670 [compost metagenome]
MELLRDLMNHVDHRTVAVTHHGDHVVGKSDRLRFAGQQQGALTQRLDAHYL